MRRHHKFWVDIIVPDDDVVILALDGNLDDDASHEFRELLFALVDQDSQRVIVDLTTASNFGFSEVGVLATAARRAPSAVSIVCSDGFVLGLMSEVKLDRICNVFSSLTAAFSALSAGRVDSPPQATERSERTG